MTALVREFHEAFGLARADAPTLADAETRRLRATLILEEAAEVIAALYGWGDDYATWLGHELDAYVDDLEIQVSLAPASPSLESIAKELADLRYVVDGAAVAYGIPLDAVFAAVHASNMSKLQDGEVLRRADGKVLKSDNYQPADEVIAGILKEALGACPQP